MSLRSLGGQLRDVGVDGHPVRASGRGRLRAGATVTIEVEDTVLRVLDEHDQVLTVVPRTSRKEVTRFKAYGHTDHAPTSKAFASQLPTSNRRAGAQT